MTDLYKLKKRIDEVQKKINAKEELVKGLRKSFLGKPVDECVIGDILTAAFAYKDSKEKSKDYIFSSIGYFKEDFLTLVAEHEYDEDYDEILRNLLACIWCLGNREDKDFVKKYLSEWCLDLDVIMDVDIEYKNEDIDPLCNLYDYPDYEDKVSAEFSVESVLTDASNAVADLC